MPTLPMPAQRVPKAVRWRSPATFLEYPVISIAMGPDPASNEARGHARGVIALGDIATGVIAVGGVARGVLALGGLAIGGIAVGGGAIGIVALAGLAVGYLAGGGAAIGYAAIGGLAVGQYAMGGAAFGKYVIGASHRDPQAVEFFSRLCNGGLFPPGVESRR